MLIFFVNFIRVIFLLVLFLFLHFVIVAECLQFSFWLISCLSQFQNSSNFFCHLRLRIGKVYVRLWELSWFWGNSIGIWWVCLNYYKGTFLGVFIGVHLHEEVELVVFVAEVVIYLATDKLLYRVLLILLFLFRLVLF